MILRVGNIFMRRFLPEDTELLYHLINRPEVRKGMSKSDEITYQSHVGWIKRNLIKGNNVHLFLVTHEGQGLGVALIKNITQNSAELGIMVGNSITAQKMLLTGKLIAGILHYAFDEMKLQYLEIRIIPENSKSIATAKKIGADFQRRDDIYMYFLLEKTRYETHPFNMRLFDRYRPVCLAS